MKLNVYWKVLLVAASITWLIIIHLITEKSISIQNATHPPIKIEDSINGIVEKISGNRGVDYITLNNTHNFRIINTVNENYEPSSIGFFLTIEDSIAKISNCDTLYVYRESDKYFFIIGKRVKAINSDSLKK